MIANKNKSFLTLTKGVEFLFKKNKISYFKGTGNFKTKNQISVIDNNYNEKIIETKNVIIRKSNNSGSISETHLYILVR